MNTNYIEDQTEKVANQVEFVNQVEESNGQKQIKSAGVHNYIKLYLRDTSIVRDVLPAESQSDGDFEGHMNDPEPYIRIQIESAWEPAVVRNYESAPEQAVIGQTEFHAYFFILMTKEYYVNLEKIKKFKHDPRDMVVASLAPEIQNLEDTIFFKTVDASIGNQGVANPSTGVIQNRAVNCLPTGGTYGPIAFNRSSVARVQTYFPSILLTTGIGVVNTQTWSSLAAEDRNTVGGDLSQAYYEEGIKAKRTNVFAGIPFRVTLKNWIVPDNVMYLFSEPKYFGTFFEEYGPQLFVQKFVDTVRFFSREKISLQLPNIKAMQRFTFFINGNYDPILPNYVPTTPVPPNVQ